MEYCCGPTTGMSILISSPQETGITVNPGLTHEATGVQRAYETCSVTEWNSSSSHADICPPTLPTFCSLRPLCRNSHVGGSDSPQGKLLTWRHGCCYSTITEASQRKLDTSSILKNNNVYSTVSRASSNSSRVWGLSLHYFPFITQDCICAGLHLEFSTIIISTRKVKSLYLLKADKIF